MSLTRSALGLVPAAGGALPLPYLGAYPMKYLMRQPSAGDGVSIAR
jgi:hypothetical protein